MFNHILIEKLKHIYTKFIAVDLEKYLPRRCNTIKKKPELTGVFFLSSKLKKHVGKMSM